METTSQPASERVCSVKNCINLRTSYSNKCKECNAKFQKEYRAANPELFKEYDLKKIFGISLEDYTKLWDSQEGVCAICKQPEIVVDSKTQRVRNLAVDHCHEGNFIRGLLCMACNQGIGNFREDISKLASAIKYLEERKTGVLTLSKVGVKQKYKQRGRQSKPVKINLDDILG